ncbi:MAG TPA: fused MFS/spermidine synthase [Polyangia bacterium]|nr:fused MFS/spermidine synthase [Polyangia bacterium]
MIRPRASLPCVALALAVGMTAGRNAQAEDRPAPVHAAECDTTDLLAGRRPYADADVRGNVALVTDGTVAPEGAPWDAPAAVKLVSRAASITYDLGQPRGLSAFYLQADANDTYKIAGSNDGRPGSFRVLAEIANVVERGHGLRARAVRIEPATVRYLRISDPDGDGFFSVSELAAYCLAPTPFPPIMSAVAAPAAVAPRAPEKPATVEPAPSHIGWIEIVLGAGIALLAGLGIARRRRGAPSTSRSADDRPFPLILLLFVASGCAALIYEIVWFQMIQLVLGSSAVSIAVLLGTFMGGMCLGSLGLARFVSRRRHPLRVYAILEVAIGVSGILMLGAIPLVEVVYTAVVGHGIPGLLLRGLFAAICLLPPTVMMGATLPAVSRWVELSPRGVSWLGIFYGGNTLGAVFGCLLAGFYLLRVHDMHTATFVAVALNAAVAVGALVIARVRTGSEPSETGREPAAVSTPTAPVWIVYVAIGLSGMSALGAEVIWTRLFGLLLSHTTYTFSIILAVFLIGIGLGSGVGSFVARRTPDARRALGLAQLALVVVIAWASWNITSALPYWPVNPRLAATPWNQFQIDLVRCLWAILPAACLWGASFPLALAAVASKGSDGGVVVGRVYAANTVGAIVGALGTSLVLIVTVGTQNSQRILIALSALAAVLTLVPALVRAVPRFATRDAIWTLAIVALAVLVGRNVVAVPPLLVGHGRFSAVERNTKETFLFVGEGMNSSPAVSRDLNGVLSYYNAGKIQASTLPQDMRLQRMLGHLTTLLPAHPREVLVIACGAGVTAGAASIDPRVERLTIAEIEPLVPKVVAPFFGAFNDNVVDNPKVHVEVDDARHFLTTTKQRFDAITSDPFDPWVKGAANLYTREFWELAKRHLNPGGAVTVFVQLYDSGMAAVKSEVATFFEAFPNGTIWGNTVQGQGYDVVLLGQVEPTRIDVDALEGRLQSPEFAPLAQSLRQIGFDSAAALLSTYGGRGTELGPWLKDAEVNRDDNLRLQFLAGFGMNVDQRAEIYRGILAFRHYPEDLFVGSPGNLNVLRAAIAVQ